MTEPSSRLPALSRKLFALAGALGFLAVALGAFGAHGLKSGLLKDLPDAAQRLAWWETGVDYHMWHALLLVGIAALAARVQARSLAVAAILVVVGVALFSGSLYVMTLTGVRWLGAITPFGGTAFLAAWIALALAALRARAAQ